VPEGDVHSFLVNPDAQRVVYDADQEADLTYELYASPLEHAPGPGPRTHQASPPDSATTAAR